MSQETELNKAISTILGEELEIDSVRAVGGGSISQAYAVRTSAGDYFVKANHESHALIMFEAEMDGLTTLKDSSRFSIPAVYGAKEINGTAYLLMGLIDSAARNPTYWPDFGRNLAVLHRVKHESFGYHRPNFIGSLPQSNQLFSSWAEFFIAERMLPMIKLARNQQLVDDQFVRKFEAAMPKIVKEMPEERPSLVHGDLWSGNLMVDHQGQATIIDPAVYYGHREMDIAFSQMFGGFSQEYYDVYHEAYPMEPGFAQRAGLYNLYPYLVHLNLFGRSYFGHIDQTIRQFT